MGRFPALRCPVRGGDGRLPAQDSGDLFTVVGGAAELTLRKASEHQAWATAAASTSGASTSEDVASRAVGIR
ncbi:hypothetical protein [Frankia sp. Cr2]|uniref:hypothetical protein n=1 Tax=Frankia sp. Cr2 TaxID=3073932 RepID=UPI002AD23294|nr:hypothetical protein [Frankia sp. Cr2]